MYSDYDVAKIESIKELIYLMDSEYRSMIAFSCVDRDWTFGEFVEQILKLSASLNKTQQNNVQILLKDSVSFASLYLATVAVGKVAILGDVEISVPEDMIVITDDNFSEYINEVPCSISSIPEPDTKSLCTILHSSGTSSKPKGIMLSQQNLCSVAVGALEKYYVEEGQRIINIIPYYHIFGLVCNLLCPLLKGVTIYIIEDKNHFFVKMAQIKPDVLNVPPIIAETILKLIKSTGSVEMITGGRLKKILCGGAGLKAGVASELRKFGIYAYGCYGLTECAAGVAISRDDYYKDGSAGVPFNCNEVFIADDGEILVRGSNVMLGYYNDPDATEKAIVDGVLHTGDLGYIDEDGFLFITGRKSNLIVFDDGKKCCPEPLEEKIVANSPAEEALVYKSNNDRPTLSAQIYITKEEHASEVRVYIEESFTDHRFDFIEFTLEPLPRNANGKIRRK